MPNCTKKQNHRLFYHCRYSLKTTIIYLIVILFFCQIGYSQELTNATASQKGNPVTAPLAPTITRIWIGTNSKWDYEYNWSPAGIPNNNDHIIIRPAQHQPRTPDGAYYRAHAKTLTIEEGASLEIPLFSVLFVTSYINIKGTLKMDYLSEIIQEENISNTGTVTIEARSQKISRYDYSYWSSPVTLASGFTLGKLSPNTLPDKYFRWQPTIANGHGNWISVDSTTTMVPGIGYSIRGPQTFPPNPTTRDYFYTKITGTPNNGDITVPIVVGTDANVGGNVTADDDQWNLIGNPYPSAVDITLFLNNPANSALLDGTIYIWTHSRPLSNHVPSPFYGTYMYNYTAADYSTINKFGATSTVQGYYGVSSKYIAPRQAFFVKGLANGNAKFTNNMRADGVYLTRFARTASNTKTDTKKPSATSPEPEQHRIWLNLTNESGAFRQILVGYHTEATMGFDRSLDGQSFGNSGVTFYSIIPEMHLTIQARSLPFEQDQIPLGFTADTQNTYQIGIDHLDGIADSQAIYLEDKLQNSIFDLRTAPYSFTSEAGTFNNRFVLRFTNGTLGTNECSLKNEITLLRGNELTVHSATEKIKAITAFDLLGRKIATYKNIPKNEVTLKSIKKSRRMVFLKITLESGITVDRKTLF